MFADTNPTQEIRWYDNTLPRGFLGSEDLRKTHLHPDRGKAKCLDWGQAFTEANSINHSFIVTWCILLTNIWYVKLIFNVRIISWSRLRFDQPIAKINLSIWKKMSHFISKLEQLLFFLVLSFLLYLTICTIYHMI